MVEGAAAGVREGAPVDAEAVGGFFGLCGCGSSSSSSSLGLACRAQVAGLFNSSSSFAKAGGEPRGLAAGRDGGRGRLAGGSGEDCRGARGGRGRGGGLVVVVVEVESGSSGVGVVGIGRGRRGPKMLLLPARPRGGHGVLFFCCLC